MDQYLRELIQEDTPQLNPDVANGLAVKHIPYSEEYLDSIFRSVIGNSIPGLEYLGCERCTPEMEFEDATRARCGTKRFYDAARSDIYMMRFRFSYNGVELPSRYIFLPFVGEAGTLILSGSRWLVSPVLADKVFSISSNKIFIRLLRDKINIERTPHNIMVNGRRMTVQVAWTLMYHKPPSMRAIKPTIKAECALFHYILCKYGFHEAIEKFGNTTPIIGTTEINISTYPEDSWVIVSSTEIKPNKFGRGAYNPSRIRVAIKRSDYNRNVENLLAGFFYVVDYFPDRITPQFVDSKRLWIILLGHILFSGNISEGKLFDDVSDHFNSLDEYIDAIVKPKLEDRGVYVNDLYELFGVVINKLNDWILESSDTINSMYGKELSILYYVLYKISTDIVKMYFKLKSSSLKKELSEKEVLTLMNRHLKSRGIFNLVDTHMSTSTESYSGDNKVFKITSILVGQSDSGRISGGKDKANVAGASNRLHSSIAEVGSYLFLPKSEPTGRTRINPHLQLGTKGEIRVHEQFKDLLQSVEEKIKRK